MANSMEMDGSRALAYRLPYEYCSWGKDLEKYINRLKCELEDGEAELMMFYGVGNHGGGPTKENIKSIHALNDREDMPVMEMGTTAAFFANIKGNGRVYPEYSGDLQHHASGCYSVHSRLKRENRRAEELLVAAESWSAVAALVVGQPYPEDAPGSAPAQMDETMLENERFRISFSPLTGYMASLYDKKNDLEVLRREGARLSVLEDKSDTWSHNIFKFDKEKGDMRMVYRKVLENGPVRAAIRIKYQYNQSYVIQDFRLYKDLDYVEVKLHIDWREPQTMLRVKYPVNFNFRKPTYEIPFGYIEKSANGEKEPGQAWFDFTGEHFKKGCMYGLAIANDAKYSYSMDADEMNLTILKNSVLPIMIPKNWKRMWSTGMSMTGSRSLLIS